MNTLSNTLSFFITTSLFLLLRSPGYFHSKVQLNFRGFISKKQLSLFVTAFWATFIENTVFLYTQKVSTL